MSHRTSSSDSQHQTQGRPPSHPSSSSSSSSRSRVYSSNNLQAFESGISRAFAVPLPASRPGSRSSDSSPAKQASTAVDLPDAERGNNGIMSPRTKDAKKRPFSFIVTGAPRWTWVHALVLGISMAAIACSVVAVVLSVRHHGHRHEEIDGVADADAVVSASSRSVVVAASTFGVSSEEEGDKSSNKPRSLTTSTSTAAPPPSSAPSDRQTAPLGTTAQGPSLPAFPNPGVTPAADNTAPGTLTLPPILPPSALSPMTIPPTTTTPAPPTGPPPEWDSFTIKSTFPATSPLQPTATADPMPHAAAALWEAAGSLFKPEPGLPPAAGVLGPGGHRWSGPEEDGAEDGAPRLEDHENATDPAGDGSVTMTEAPGKEGLSRETAMSFANTTTLLTRFL